LEGIALGVLASGDDDEEIRQRIERFLLWNKYVARYMYPDRESVVWMADKLETWRALESGDPDCLLEKEFLPFYREAVREFRKRIDACLEHDAAFLRNLSDAAALAAKGKVLRKYDADDTRTTVFESQGTTAERLR
jgi:hypothetical protein